MRKVTTFATVVLAAVAMPGAAIAAPGSGTVSYDEATALGLRTLPTPEQVGLPPCRPDPTWRGFATPEEATRTANTVADQDPICVSDAREARYSIHLSPRKTPAGSGDANYRWAGAQTNGRYQGGRLTVEVGNPGVGHGGPREFVAARVLAFTPINRWIEAGWTEDTIYGDARYVYTAQVNVNGYSEVLHTQYPLSDGSFYIFRVKDYANSWGDAEIWWGGAWNLLDTNPSMLCLYSYGTPNCNIEEATEAYSADFTWPTLNAPVSGSGVNFYDTMLRTAPSTWVFWNDALYPSWEFGDSPYSACWNSRDWDFRTPQGAC